MCRVFSKVLSVSGKDCRQFLFITLSRHLQQGSPVAPQLLKPNEWANKNEVINNKVVNVPTVSLHWFTSAPDKSIKKSKPTTSWIFSLCSNQSAHACAHAHACVCANDQQWRQVNISFRNVHGRWGWFLLSVVRILKPHLMVIMQMISQ